MQGISIEAPSMLVLYFYFKLIWSYHIRRSALLGFK